MRRAVVSKPSNIAEGFGRKLRKDLINFYIVSGLISELDTHLEIAERLKYLLPAEVNDSLNSIRKMLFGLISSLKDSKIMINNDSHFSVNCLPITVH